MKEITTIAFEIVINISDTITIFFPRFEKCSEKIWRNGLFGVRLYQEIIFF